MLSRIVSGSVFVHTPVIELTALEEDSMSINWIRLIIGGLMVQHHVRLTPKSFSQDVHASATYVFAL